MELSVIEAGMPEVVAAAAEQLAHSLIEDALKAAVPEVDYAVGNADAELGFLDQQNTQCYAKTLAGAWQLPDYWKKIFFVRSSGCLPVLVFAGLGSAQLLSFHFASDVHVQFAFHSTSVFAVYAAAYCGCRHLNLMYVAIGSQPFSPFCYSLWYRCRIRLDSCHGLCPKNS